MNTMNTHTLNFHSKTILAERIEKGTSEMYKLSWPDGRHLVMEQQDEIRTESTTGVFERETNNTRWVIVYDDGGPAWVNTEQLQVIGELVTRIE
jgi:hypothetical protein